MNNFFTFIERHWALSALFVILLIAVLLYEKFNQSQDTSGISADEAVRLMNREDAIVLDVRRKEAFKSGHIIKAINIPFLALKTDIKKLKQHKDKAIIVVCSQGMESIKAAKMISENEFEHVKVIKGGVKAWREAGLPLEKS